MWKNHIIISKIVIAKIKAYALLVSKLIINISINLKILKKKRVYHIRVNNSMFIFLLLYLFVKLLDISILCHIVLILAITIFRIIFSILIKLFQKEYETKTFWQYISIAICDKNIKL